MGMLDDLLGKEKNNVTVYQIVRQFAEQAGWEIKIENSDCVVISFEDELGSEDVFIKICGKNNEGKTILEFSSVGIPFPDDISLAALFGLTLLERNAELLMGHWGIEDISSNKNFKVFLTMILEGMDVSDFKFAVMAVLIEKKKLLVDAIMIRLKQEATEPMTKNLNFVFKSSHHLRYDNGKQVSGPAGEARRAVKVEPNINGNSGHTVTIFNLDGNHPVWQNNIQMAPKQMKVIEETENKIVLRGYGHDQMGNSFADYFLTIWYRDEEVEKCVLHIHDRNIDIEYLPWNE